jgi:hypothetical protein
VLVGRVYSCCDFFFWTTKDPKNGIHEKRARNFELGTMFAPPAAYIN